jgi:hypothetical protein
MSDVQFVNYDWLIEFVASFANFTLSDALERFWEESVVSWMRYYLCLCLDRLKKTTRNLIQEVFESNISRIQAWTNLFGRFIYVVLSRIILKWNTRLKLYEISHPKFQNSVHNVSWIICVHFLRHEKENGVYIPTRQRVLVHCNYFCMQYHSI